MTHFFHTISDALVSYGPWGLLLLAFLDSAGVPVSAGMDVIVLVVAAKAPERAYLGAALAVLGSVANGWFNGANPTGFTPAGPKAFAAASTGNMVRAMKF